MVTVVLLNPAIALESFQEIHPHEENAVSRCLIAIVLSSLIAFPAVAAETFDAVWKQQQVDFTFQGLDVAYTCDLMKGRIETLLRHVGAKEVRVSIPSCGGFKYAQREHRIIATFSTLVPAGDDDVDIVQAAWTEVQLGKKHPWPIDDQDCQLLEQFQEYLLSEIEHEVIEGATGCGATRLTIAGKLRLKVLEPVSKGDETGKDN